MLIQIFAFQHAWITIFRKDLKGATAIEYGLIVCGISLIIMASVFFFGGSLKTLFSAMATNVSSSAEKIK